MPLGSPVVENNVIEKGVFMAVGARH